MSLLTKPWSEMTTDEIESLVKDARQILSTAYQHEIESLAQELMEEVRKERLDADSESVDRWINETLDGHHDVIYTYAAQNVVCASDNDGAYVSEFGADGLVQDGCLDWSKLAYSAMRADLLEELSRQNFDVNDPAAWLEEQKEKEG